GDDRAVAEWVLELGGQVRVYGGPDVWFSQRTGLPQGPFRLCGISLFSAEQVNDVGLEHLNGLTGLQNLDLANTDITDAGLERLQGLTGLQQLGLDHTRISGAGLEHLKGMTRLQMLRLSETRMTDAGLEHLKGLKGLQYLDLSGTQGLSDAGLQ